MASILCIDTSGTNCSVALSIDGNTLVRRTSKSREHVRLVLPMVDELLIEAGIKLFSLDAIAFTQGPGSFTGLRIGLGVVQGLAFGGGELPVIALSSLQVMAQRAIRLNGLELNSLVIPALDARMGELYWGIYRQVKGLAHPVIADSLGSRESITLPSLAATEKGQDVDSLIEHLLLAGVGDGWQFKPELYFDGAVVISTNIDENIRPDAEDIVDLARLALQQGRVSSIDDVQPIYLRNTISWQKRLRLRNQ